MADNSSSLAPFHQRIAETPVVAGEKLAVEILDEIMSQCAIPRAVAPGPVRDLLLGTIEGSPYLSGLMRRDPARLAAMIEAVPEKHLDAARVRSARSLVAARARP